MPILYLEQTLPKTVDNTDKTKVQSEMHQSVVLKTLDSTVTDML